jgi:Flp pilus assembly protein TadD
MLYARVAVILTAVGLLAGSSALAGDKNDPYAMPPDVKAIMQRMQHGKMPSPAEQQRMTAWSNGLTGKPARTNPGGPAPGGLTSIASDDDEDDRSDAQIGADMCRKGGHAPGLGQKVSKDAYLAMATAMKEKYRGKMDSNTATLLFQTLERQHWSTIGGQFAAPLMARNSWVAAVVSAASGAERAPDDAMTANNLGSALRGLKDYGNAAIAFNYARTRAPDSAIVASNLGSLAISYHDTGAARRFYFAALSKAKNMAVPNAELGLMSLCDKKLSMANKYFRASLRGGYTTLAADGLYSTERYQQQQNPGADVGQASDDSSGNGGKNAINPYLPTPPIADNIRQVVGWSNGNINPDKKWQTQWLADMEAQGHEADALVASSHPRPSTSAKGATVVFERGYEKETFLLGDLERVFARQFYRVQTRDRNDLESLKVRVLAHDMTGDNCSVTRPIAMSAYPAYAILAKADWPAIAKVWSDKFKAMGPLLAQIHDDSLREQLAKRQFVLAYDDEAAFAQEQGLAQGYTVLALQLTSPCGALPAFDNQLPPKGAKKLKTWPSPCKIHESMNFGIASFKGDCDKMTLEITVEVFTGSMNVNWGKDESQDQITIFGGFAANPSVTQDAGGLADIGGSAKVGEYITFKGGELTDTGLIATISATGQLGPGAASADNTIKYSTVGNNDFGTMKNGVVSGGTVFNQSTTFQIQPPGLPEM